jgi:hypothetical protein
LSGAIESIDFNAVNYLVNKEGANITESSLKKALDQAKERTRNLKEDDKKQDQEGKLTQIIELLEAKLKNISAEAAAPSVDDSAATVSQVTPAAEPKESKDDQPDSPSLSPQSSLDSDYSKLESNDGRSGGERAQTPSGSNSSSSSFEKIDEEPVITITNSNGGNSQPANEGRPAVFPFSDDSPPSSDDEKELLLGKANEGDSALKSNSPQDTQPKTLIPSGRAGSVFTEGNKPVPTLTPEPTSTPEPMPSLTSKKPKQVNNTTPQNTKSSNLHIIAASILAIAGVALEVTIAVHLEMLTVGIVVGACCLVAAAVMYHYKWPSSFIENNKVEKVAPNEKKEPVATSV